MMAAAVHMDFPCGICVNTFDAASKGHVQCLKFAEAHGYSWHDATSSAAAAHGKLNCLQFIFEHDLPCTSHTALITARMGHLKCLRFIYEYCGEKVTWKQSRLQDFEENDLIPEHIKEYLRSVQDDWKSGNNIGAWITPARR